MKAIYKTLLATAVLVPSMTSCVEEVFPSNAITEEQLHESDKSIEALVWAMPAFMNNYNTQGGGNAYDWGYGSIMHIRDVMTGDFAVVNSSYDWYTAWEQNTYIGEGYASTQFIWNFLTQMVLTTNNLIGSIDEENASEEQLQYLGAAHAYRAAIYLDMARMYEYCYLDVNPSSLNGDGKDVLGLTVPIVTEKTTEEESRNNPRVPHMEMSEFILSDLTKAETFLENAGTISKTIPNLAVVYGLYARLHLWNGGFLSEPWNGGNGNAEYNLAAQYARKAIMQSGASPLTESEWLSTTNGFNDISTSSWLWGATSMKENDVVQSGILNWTSWASNETTYGYASAGPFSMISSYYYNRISDTDFRKLSYIAPEGSALEGKEPVIDQAYAEKKLKEYYSLKFRPGQGNMEDYTVGSACSYPLMRVEEMYFIEAEATAHTSPAAGAQLLADFMTKYRDPDYVIKASGEEDVVEEIFFQKSIELWGEGQNYFDLKRLGYPVTRSNSTNYYSAARLDTSGRPAWLNFVIVQTEGTNNTAIYYYNNPDPSQFPLIVTPDEDEDEED